MDGSRSRVTTGATGTTLAGLALATLAACNPFVVRSQPDRAVALYPDAATMASQWNGTLAPYAGAGAAADAPRVGGAVTATPALDQGGTYVYVSLTAAPSGAAYAWRLREGACGAGGAVVGAPAAYGALAVNDRGRAAASATVSQHLAPATRYHVDVLASSADAAPIVACGDLTPPTR